MPTKHYFKLDCFRIYSTLLIIAGKMIFLLLVVKKLKFGMEKRLNLYDLLHGASRVISVFDLIP